MEKKKGQRAHILLNDEIMETIIPPLIEEVMGPEYNFEITATACADEILEAVEIQSFDLFAFLLNNIIFREVGMHAESNFRRALRLVIHLKARYKTPIIGLYGHPTGPAYARQARLAGADFAFQIPCTKEVLTDPIKQCLDKSFTREYP